MRGLVQRLTPTRLGTRRAVAGWLLGVLAPPGLTGLLLQNRDVLGLPSDLMMFFVLVVATAIVGGLAPSLVCAVLSASLLNYVFTEPTGTWWITDPEDVLALVAFTLVAAAVASVVDLAERRAVQAAAAQERAEAARDAQARLVEEREALRDASRRARELEQVDALRTALLTAASHDLRTPLAAIRAAVDVLHAPGVDLSEADRREMTAAVASATGRLERIVDDLLDLSRLQMGAVEPRLRPTDLVEVVLPAVDGLSSDQIAVDLPDGLPLVSTDAGLLERVVANVAANAVRHSPPGRPARIEVRVGRGAVVVVVTDHGPGVAPEERERMFEPFQRVGADRPDGPHRAGGMGLGLAVARGLADALGVRLRVGETPGGGLTMEIEIPRAAGGPG